MLMIIISKLGYHMTRECFPYTLGSDTAIQLAWWLPRNNQIDSNRKVLPTKILHQYEESIIESYKKMSRNIW